ncbi:MAG: 4-hydroxy-tetrahydrodipicolinate reductase [Eubacteriales bacterium]|jgi:4-hydroxy-tetrahydrodipicolinate reductase
MSEVKVILNGACGHMGRVVSEIASQDPDVKIVAGVDAFGEAYSDFPLFHSIDECTVPADVIIDFSTAKAVDAVVRYGGEKNIPMVICTTGLSDEQVEEIKKTSAHVAVLRSGNMSLGINLLLKLLKTASQTLLPNGFDPEIVEEHHRRKLDAPSGTAVMLADSINEAGGGDYTYVYGRSDRREQRPQKEIGISSVRGGTIVGVHDVIFAGQDEVIEIKHTAYSRAIFAKGAVSAAKFLVGAKPGLYDMSDVIDAMAK